MNRSTAAGELASEQLVIVTVQQYSQPCHQDWSRPRYVEPRGSSAQTGSRGDSGGKGSRPVWGQLASVARTF